MQKKDNYSTKSPNWWAKQSLLGIKITPTFIGYMRMMSYTIASPTPDETNNIIDLPETAATVAALKEEVLNWLVATTDNIPWDPDPRFPKIEHGQHEKFDPED